MSEGYRVIRSVFATRDALLARPRSDLADALDDMGTGIVIDAANKVVAFHENHLRVVTAGVGHYRA